MNKREKEVYEGLLDREDQVLRDLKKQYERALRDIDEKIRLLQSDELTQSRVYQINYQKALRGQVEAIIEKLHGDEYSTIQQYLHDSYTDAYVGTMYAMSGSGVHIIQPIDRNAAVKAVVTDSELSTTLYGALGYDMDILKKHVREEITRGIATSLPYEQIARNISNYTTLPLSNAKRIVRTEGHRIQQASADDARNVAKSKGADVVKQWDASMDGATRPLHRELDGQIRETDEPFEAGGKKVMYPGKFGDPSQDCNCRCVALTRARWALDEKELETLKERAAYFGLDKTEDFEDYKKKYLKAAEEQKGLRKIDFTPAKNIAEAEKFAEQFVDSSTFGAVGVSYKGVGLDVANEINRTLNSFYGNFDVKKLGGVAAPAKNTKLGQKISAHAAYSPVRKSLLLNRDNTKTLEKFVSGLLADKNAMNDILTHPERYDMNKASARFRNIIEMSKKTGRALVPETAEEAIYHELGHHLENFFTRDEWETVKQRMPDYADKISGYATDDRSEYIAESFASYMKGEDVIDPFVRGIFDGWRK